MSAEATAWAFRHSPFTGATLLVHLAMADSVSDMHDNEFWMSVKRLAAKARVTRRSAQRALRDIEEAGLLRLVSSTDGDTRRYVFIMPSNQPVLYESRGVASTPPGRKSPREGGVTSTPGGRHQYAQSQIEPKDQPNANLTTPPPAGGGPVPPVRQVFEAWRDSTGRSSRTVLDDKRRRLIERALERYPLGDVLDAVRGWEHGAFYRGINDRKIPYHDLTLLLRDAEHIERFRDLWRGPRQPDRPGRPSIDTVVQDRTAPSGRVEL